MKAKVFDAILTSILERDMNKWLEENPDIEITRMTQSVDQGYHTVVTILYKEEHKN